MGETKYLTIMGETKYFKFKNHIFRFRWKRKLGSRLITQNIANYPKRCVTFFQTFSTVCFQRKQYITLQVS